MSFLLPNLKRQWEPLKEEETPDQKYYHEKRNQTYKKSSCINCKCAFIVDDESENKEDFCLRCRWIRKLMPFLFDKPSEAQPHIECDCCDSYME